MKNADPNVCAKKRAAVHPKLFQLSINYRSHGGIVNAASSVIDLLSDFFPDSIDKLERESGLASGPKPVFFTGWKDSVKGFEHFVSGKG